MGRGMGMRRSMGRGMGMGRGEEGMGGGMRSRGGMSGEYGFAAPHAMIRHVDFFARPGRSYVYRFQLVLLDVNGKGQTRSVYLEKDVKKRVDATKLTATPIIRTEWSEPTKPVSIPLAGNVIIGEAQRPAAGEPTVTMVVESFDIGDDGKAMQGSIEKAKVRIGTVMNAIEKDVWILSSEERAILEKVERFRFRTGMTVLDIDGGDKLSKKLVAPANVLMMDATGRLSVRSELNDMAAYEDYRDIFEEDEDDAGSFRGGGEFRGGEFEMGF